LKNIDKTESALERLDRNTDLIISKDNIIKIEYLSGGKQDFFKLEYSFTKNVYTHSCGLIKQIYNNYTRPEIRLPKLTDQNWVIKAPYGKRIALITKFIDLLYEEPCTKAKISFYESNGTLIQTKCGHEDYEIDINSDQANLLMTQSNELAVKFSTQNTKEVVFTQNGAGSNPEVYRGFNYYYSFVETPGDCYFQSRKNIFCNYTNLGVADWTLNEEDQANTKRGAEENNFDKLFCSHCYIEATLPLQNPELDKDGNSNTAVFLSPLINRQYRFLKFSYRLINSGVLSVKLIYAKELTKKFEHSVLLKTFNEADDWTKATVKIGNQLFHSFRIAFVLEKAELDSEIQPKASIDSIQLFERDLDCSSSMDDAVCDADDLIHNINIEKNKNILGSNWDSKFCQKYAAPCEANKCLNGGICLNKEDSIGSINYVLGKGTNNNVFFF
jgi:hypothetical protein